MISFMMENQEDKLKLLELLYKLAICDDQYDVDEEFIVAQLQVECGTDEIPDTATIEELISYFENKDLQTRKIVLSEILALIYVDDYISLTEHLYYSQILEAFGFTEDEAERIAVLVQAFFQVSMDFMAFVHNDAFDLDDLGLEVSQESDDDFDDDDFDEDDFEDEDDEEFTPVYNDDEEN